MCVIITSPGSEARPTLDQLRLCERANRHGSGLAWLRGRSVRYVKGLTADEIAERLPSIEGPAIIHFRIASVGGVRPDLCHPFPVTHRAELCAKGSARAVLFHNGTWSEYRQYADHFAIRFPRREGASDTRFAASFVARFGFAWLKRAAYCRWALLDRSGIHRIGSWSEIDGCHYSNGYWLSRPSSGDYDQQSRFRFEDEDEQ